VRDVWPILIIASVSLALVNYFNLLESFNGVVRPVTWLLGLPPDTGTSLIFGIFRKELALIMLRQALNVTDFARALTPVQMVVYSVFAVFYVPCFSTLKALRREFGWVAALGIVGLTVAIALLAALAARGLALILY
jgi:ferrous iron transport protein B